MRGEPVYASEAYESRYKYKLPLPDVAECDVDSFCGNVETVHCPFGPRRHEVIRICCLFRILAIFVA